jgi:nucleotide-binding universal stress UspA family protein
MIGKILIPTDFSRSSRHALEYAVDLNRVFAARLLLLHVIQDFTDLSEYNLSPSILPQIHLELEQTASHRLEEMVTGMVPSSMHCDTYILHGIPYYETVTFAFNERVDLIVVGSHGRSGILRVLFGQTAEKIVKKAHCAVLTVKDPEFTFRLP